MNLKITSVQPGQIARRPLIYRVFEQAGVPEMANIVLKNRVRAPYQYSAASIPSLTISRSNSIPRDGESSRPCQRYAPRRPQSLPEIGLRSGFLAFASGRLNSLTPTNSPIRICGRSGTTVTSHTLFDCDPDPDFSRSR
jgi:hypothetical protein